LSNPLDRLYRGDVLLVLVSANGSMTLEPPAGAVVLAASFNPLHRGHISLLEAGARAAGGRPFYEISIVNVEKPVIERQELERRLAQFSGRAPVIVTRSPTFAGKARLMPGTTFVIGFDTAVRLFDDRFYPPYDAVADTEGLGSATAVALEGIRREGCRFAVGGRIGQDGRFHTLSEIVIPPRFTDMFIEVPERDFRADISSTELRARRKQDG
jgi:hypothetical protein